MKNISMEDLVKTKHIYEDLLKYIDEDPEIIGSAICVFLDSYQYRHDIDLKIDDMRSSVYNEMGSVGAEV